MKVIVILLVLFYVLIAISRVGLFLWEVSSVLVIYTYILATSGYLIYKGLTRNKKPKQRNFKNRSVLNILFILTLIAFPVWAFIPPITAPMYAKRFDTEFVETFGPDYEGKIPASVRVKLSDTPFSWIKMIKREIPDNYHVVKGVYYGNLSKQYVDLYYPKVVTGALPAIILIHGGATKNIDNRNLGEVNAARYFTKQGLIVISVEYRTPPEGHFLEMVHDVRTAIAWIRMHAEEYHIDKTQLFVMGRSRGGELATAAVYSGMNNNSWYRANAGDYSPQELEVKAVISIYGEVNAYMAEEWGNNYVVGLNEIVFGVKKEEDPNLYRNASAEYLIGNNTPPTFLMHGSKDQAAFPIESRHLSEVLTKKGVLNVYLELPTGKHAFDAYPWSPGGQLLFYYLERFIWYMIFN